MVKYERNDEIDLDLYEYYLGMNGNFVHFNRDILENAMNEMSATSGVYNLMAVDTMIHKSAGQYSVMNKNVVFGYLTRVERCPSHYFFTRHTQGMSLDSKRCLTPLLENGYAHEFLTYYMAYKSFDSRSNKLKKILDVCRETDAEAADGSSLTRLTFSVNRQPNYRYNYSQFDIIGQIPKKYASCIGAEDGYVLAWGDFAQSDFRIAYNLFMRSPENDAIMLQYEDKYEGLARIVNSSLGVPFDKDKFAEERKLYKTLTLATMYGTQGTVIKENAAFIQMFNRFLNLCPKYVEYRERIKRSHSLGLPIEFLSYFGNSEISPVFPKEEQTVDRALNAPIQMGTSEIVIMTACRILRKFYDLGYSDDDVSLYFVRHDEIIFKIKEEVMKDSWVFKEFNSILVGNWIPLAMSFEFGHWYNKPEEDLQKKFEESCNKNKSRLTTLYPDLEPEDFYPVKKTFLLSVYFTIIPQDNSTVITFYDSDRKKVHHVVAETMDKEEIWEVIVLQVRHLQLDSDYKGVIVKNAIMNYSEYEGSLYLRYCLTDSRGLLDAESLNRYAVCRYCKSKGLESPVFPPLASQESFIQSVQQLKEMADDI